MTNPWQGTPTYIAARTVDDVWGAIGKLAFGAGVETTWVFRGVNDISYSVRSTLARKLESHLGRLPTEDQLVASEDTVYDWAQSWGLDRSGGVYLDMVAVMSRLQHHGVPTRLLDVTANPTTALFFATLPKMAPPAHFSAVRRMLQRPRELGKAKTPPPSTEPDGVLFAFNVTDLPVLRTDGGKPGTWESNGPSRKRWEKALEDSAATRQPFVVLPVDPDERMRAQEGRFLASSAPAEKIGVPFDCMWPPNKASGHMAALLTMMPGGVVEGGGLPGFGAFAIRIPGAVKSDLRKALSGTFNRSNKTMFPDVMGLKDTLDREWVDLFSSLPPSRPREADAE